MCPVAAEIDLIAAWRNRELVCAIGPGGGPHLVVACRAHADVGQRLPIWSGDPAGDVQARQHLNVDPGHVRGRHRYASAGVRIGRETAASGAGVATSDVGPAVVRQLDHVGAVRATSRDRQRVGPVSGGACAAGAIDVAAGQNVDVRERLPIGSGDLAADVHPERHHDIDPGHVRGGHAHRGADAPVGR